MEMTFCGIKAGCVHVVAPCGNAAIRPPKARLTSRSWLLGSVLLVLDQSRVALPVHRASRLKAGTISESMLQLPRTEWQRRRSEQPAPAPRHEDPRCQRHLRQGAKHPETLHRTHPSPPSYPVIDTSTMRGMANLQTSAIQTQTRQLRRCYASHIMCCKWKASECKSRQSHVRPSVEGHVTDGRT